MVHTITTAMHTTFIMKRIQSLHLIHPALSAQTLGRCLTLRYLPPVSKREEKASVIVPTPGRHLGHPGICIAFHCISVYDVN